ncbi:hypothetical protein SERLA73DRAFT_164252 [Serpula lacrymans var. lacrymans S7.3]|uniref:DUF6534 domain-containing protein n=1 Tax=Serpula lacrymans var. lacrymans (strain S7.3) TaxID=936435 RepID=F8QI37_SERL3|nr:hypothetical protein SERLA73DRAFT_164252 [Serpula lacrymans var. lacrymans S7.3]
MSSHVDSLEAELLMRGPQLGTMFAMTLYGITCMQTFLYYQNYSEDRWILKLTVAIIWFYSYYIPRVLETAHVGLAVGAMDYYLIVNFSEVGIMLTVHWTISVSYTIGFFITLIVNLYYSWRIWILSKQWYISATLVVFAIARLGCSLVACSYSMMYKASWLLFGKNARSIVIVSITMAIVTDTANSLILAYFLRRRRSTSGLHRTTRLINNLVIYAIGAGALCIGFCRAHSVSYYPKHSLLPRNGFSANEFFRKLVLNQFEY